jgi:prophage antirepressor-like protein
MRFRLSILRSAIRDFPADEKGMQTLHTLGGSQKLLVLYESGLYRLIMRSNKPEAEAFRRWVFCEVLPSIRKTGQYRVKQRQLYERLGKSEEWVARREEGIAARNGFTDTLKEHGLTEGWQYGRVTNTL